MLLAPRSFFLAACAVFVLLSALALYFSARQPWLGLQFEPGAAALTIAEVAPQGPAAGLISRGDTLTKLIVEGEVALPLSGALRRVNPGTLPSWSEYDAFLDSIETIHEQAVNGSLRFELADGRTVTVIPAQTRPWNELPVSWLLWLLRVAVVVILVCGLIAFLPRDTGVLGLALAGFASAGTSFALLPLEGRELVMSPDLMRALHRSLWLTHAFYGCGLALMLWNYPQRLRGHRMAWMLYLAYAVTWVAYFERWFDDPLRLQAAVSASGLFVIAILLVAQWHAAAAGSSARRGVLWFCVCIGGSLLWFTGFLLLPMSLREDPVFSTEWIEMGVFLSFLALAVGIYRERLFSVDRWLLRAWLLLLATFATLVLDLVLVFVIGLDSLASLLIAVAAIAWLYLPLRQSLWSRLWRHDDTATAQRARIDALTLAFRDDDRLSAAARWQQLLQSTFQPLHVEAQDGARAQAAVIDGGRLLCVPQLDGRSAWRLAHADGGVRLFRDEDARLADLLQSWMRAGLEQRDAQRRGADAERVRFAADLHDDVVPLLLSLIYRSEDLGFHDDVRALMPRLREVIQQLAKAPDAR